MRNGVQPPWLRVDVISVADEDGRELAIALNAARRHWSAEQRREIVAALREEGHSQRAIAGAVGVSKKQVQNDLAQVDTGIHLEPPDEPEEEPDAVDIPEAAASEPTRVKGLDGCLEYIAARFTSAGRAPSTTSSGSAGGRS